VEWSTVVWAIGRRELGWAGDLGLDVDLKWILKRIALIQKQIQLLPVWGFFTGSS